MPCDERPFALAHFVSDIAPRPCCIYAKGTSSSDFDQTSAFSALLWRRPNPSTRTPWHSSRKLLGDDMGTHAEYNSRQVIITLTPRSTSSYQPFTFLGTHNHDDRTGSSFTHSSLLQFPSGCLHESPSRLHLLPLHSRRSLVGMPS